MCDREEEREDGGRRRRSGYRTKNKNPTRQCGEKIPHPMLPDPEHNHFQASIFLLRFRAVELCFKAWQGLGKVLQTSLLCLALFQASTSVLGKHVISQLHQLRFCHALRSTMWKEGIDDSTMSSLGTELLASQYKPPGESICHPTTLRYTPVWYIFLLSP